MNFFDKNFSSGGARGISAHFAENTLHPRQSEVILQGLLGQQLLHPRQLVAAYADTKKTHATVVFELERMHEKGLL
jgi:hypothetical protein